MLDASGPVVKIDVEGVSDGRDRGALEATLRGLGPWRKGPFEVCGIPIDAEWRSDWKWERIAPHLVPLGDKRVADIGCNNGYYMFRMAAEHPREVIGFEPVERHWQTFSLLNRMAGATCLTFERRGWEALGDYPAAFDVVLCLGILYHHTDPSAILRRCHSALVSGGQLVIDCQGIPGDEPVALTPRGRYAGASGVWHVPTASCLEHWLARANFRAIEWIHNAPLSPDEQRATLWAPGKSLVDFLDSQDPTRTVEGYAAPRRFYLKARK